jgi:hypothetical protein
VQRALIGAEGYNRRVSGRELDIILSLLDECTAAENDGMAREWDEEKRE